MWKSVNMGLLWKVDSLLTLGPLGPGKPTGPCGPWGPLNEERMNSESREE